MRIGTLLAGVLLAAYLATGVYIIRGHEQGAVKRFGKVLRTDEGVVLLQSSGVYFDLPWPFAEVLRLEMNRVLELSIGSPEIDDFADGQFLQAVDPARQSQFLTGDKNILNLQVGVHFRIAEESVGEYLFESRSPERRLQSLAESTVADAVLRSGVDFVHTLGRSALRESLLHSLRTRIASQRLGVDVEDVTIGSVYPPVRVKREFLDVTNARADKEKYINESLAYAAEREADAGATARKIRDAAESDRQNTVESARARAESFTKLIEQFQRDERQGIQTYAQSRQMTLRRRYVEVMQDILRNVKSKVFLDADKPVDLTIFRDPAE